MLCLADLRTRANSADCINVLRTESYLVGIDTQSSRFESELHRWDYRVFVCSIIEVLQELKNEMRCPVIQLTDDSNSRTVSASNT